MMLTSPAVAARSTDEQLVAAVRDGSDDAFEVLVRRYRDRITAHVRRHVYDGQRAEDVVQEVFVSALRGLRSSDQEITFRPWIYMIARNACIDQARRSKRSEEISVEPEQLGGVFDMSGGFSPTELTVLRKQELDDISQAFGALPDTQHRVLVMRELEGLSYKEIGRRMRLTPAAVESMLARARTTLKGQYEEIATGARCTRMRPVMTAVSRGIAGKRDRRTLARHVCHCRNCRLEAIAVGLEEFVQQSGRGRFDRGLSKAASFFPLGWLLRRRGEGVGALANVGGDHTVSSVQKAVAVAAAVAAVAGGGGVVAHKSGVDLPLRAAQGSGQPDSTRATGGDANNGTAPQVSARSSAPASGGGRGSTGGVSPGQPGNGVPGTDAPVVKAPAPAQPGSGPRLESPALPATRHDSTDQTVRSVPDVTTKLPAPVQKVIDPVTEAPPKVKKQLDPVVKAPQKIPKKLAPDPVTPPIVKDTLDQVTRPVSGVTGPISPKLP